MWRRLAERVWVERGVLDYRNDDRFHTKRRARGRRGDVVNCELCIVCRVGLVHICPECTDTTLFTMRIVYAVHRAAAIPAAISFNIAVYMHTVITFQCSARAPRFSVSLALCSYNTCHSCVMYRTRAHTIIYTNAHHLATNNPTGTRLFRNSRKLILLNDY